MPFSNHGTLACIFFYNLNYLLDFLKIGASPLPSFKVLSHYWFLEALNRFLNGRVCLLIYSWIYRKKTFLGAKHIYIITCQVYILSGYAGHN